MASGGGREHETMRSTERSSAILISIVAFGVLTLTSLALLSLTALLGKVEFTAITDPIRWLETIARDEAFDILSNAAELLAGRLGNRDYGRCHRGRARGDALQSPHHEAVYQ